MTITRSSLSLDASSPFTSVELQLLSLLPMLDVVSARRFLAARSILMSGTKTAAKTSLSGRGRPRLDISSALILQCALSACLRRRRINLEPSQFWALFSVYSILILNKNSEALKLKVAGFSTLVDPGSGSRQIEAGAGARANK